MPAIEVSNLQRAFSADFLAVAGIDLQVAEGEIYAFLGPNGAGKTTAIRMITGSMSKYRPSPPQTPAMIRSSRLRR